jgi:hypothetical protein
MYPFRIIYSHMQLNKTRVKPIQLYYIDKKNDHKIGSGTLVNIEIPL